MARTSELVINCLSLILPYAPQHCRTVAGLTSSTSNDTLRCGQARVSLGPAASRTAVPGADSDGNAGAAVRGDQRTQVILVAVQLGLADRARRTETHPGTLADLGMLAFDNEGYRLMPALRRGLAAFGPRQGPL